MRRILFLYYLQQMKNNIPTEKYLRHIRYDKTKNTTSEIKGRRTKLQDK